MTGPQVLVRETEEERRKALTPSPDMGWFLLGAVGLVFFGIGLFDVVLAWPCGRLKGGDVRRLAARARERDSVLMACGPAAAAIEGADVRLRVEGARWSGLGRGHGHLAGREVEVAAGGRGAAARRRRARVWLPAPGDAEPGEPVEGLGGGGERWEAG